MTKNITLAAGAKMIKAWGPDPFAMNKALTSALPPSTFVGYSPILRESPLVALPSVRLGLASDLWLQQLQRPLAPSLPRRAQDLADKLLPDNLQGFSDTEWAQLLDVCTQDGIGLMWAPSAEHLRNLLQAPNRAERYAYLMGHQAALFNELEAGLGEVKQPPLQDLADLARRAVACARTGQWEGALALAGNVLNTAMEHHGVAWYRDEFKGVRGDNNVPIVGMTGPGATIQWIVDTVALPERVVGVFELPAHLVVRPLAYVFRKNETTQETFNRHLAAHRSSHDSFREVFVVPTLLNVHALLRGLDVKMRG